MHIRSWGGGGYISFFFAFPLSSRIVSYPLSLPLISYLLSVFVLYALSRAGCGSDQIVVAVDIQVAVYLTGFFFLFLVHYLFIASPFPYVARAASLSNCGRIEGRRCILADVGGRRVMEGVFGRLSVSGFLLALFPYSAVFGLCLLEICLIPPTKRCELLPHSFIGFLL